MSMTLIAITILNGMPNSIQKDRKFCDIIAAEEFALLHSCDLESRSRSTKVVLKCRVQNIHLQTRFESNPVINVRIHTKVTVFLLKFFLTESVKQFLFPLGLQILLKSSPCNLNCFITSNVILMK